MNSCAVIRSDARQWRACPAVLEGFFDWSKLSISRYACLCFPGVVTISQLEEPEKETVGHPRGHGPPDCGLRYRAECRRIIRDQVRCAVSCLGRLGYQCHARELDKCHPKASLAARCSLLLNILCCASVHTWKTEVNSIISFLSAVDNVPSNIRVSASISECVP